MRTLLLFGSLAAGVLLLVYELYRRREEQYTENSHRGSNLSDEEFIEIETSPKKLHSASITRKLPNPDDICSVCLDELVKTREIGKTAIIVLPCDHWFHQKCALRLLEYHPQCPICRTPIDAAELRRTPVKIQRQIDTNDSPSRCVNKSDMPSTSRSEKTSRKSDDASSH